MRISLIVWISLLSLGGLAQPATNVYLLEISGNELSNPVNISDNEGYNNQPSFWEDSKSVLYARTVNGQTEIARYFIDKKETAVITSTPQGSEYSPTQIPETSDISSIRLDTNGLQLLYSYDLDGRPFVLVNDLKIGYHAWFSNTELACFVLGDPATLQWIDFENSVTKIIAENIGRAIHKIPEQDAISYMDKSDEDSWEILSWNPDNGSTKKLLEIKNGVEDYCWSADGNIIHSDGSQIIKYAPNSSEKSILADLSKLGIEGKVSRLAASPDGKHLAVVIEK